MVFQTGFHTAAAVQRAESLPSDGYNANYLKTSNKYQEPVPSNEPQKLTKVGLFPEAAKQSPSKLPSSGYNSNYLKPTPRERVPAPKPYTHKNAWRVFRKELGDEGDDFKTQPSMLDLIEGIIAQVVPSKQAYWRRIYRLAQQDPTNLEVLDALANYKNKELDKKERAERDAQRNEDESESESESESDSGSESDVSEASFVSAAPQPSSASSVDPQPPPAPSVETHKQYMFRFRQDNKGNVSQWSPTHPLFVEKKLLVERLAQVRPNLPANIKTLSKIQVMEQIMNREKDKSFMPARSRQSSSQQGQGLGKIIHDNITSPDAQYRIAKKVFKGAKWLLWDSKAKKRR